MVARAEDKDILKRPKPFVLFQNNFTEMFIIMPSAKIARMVLLHLNKMAAKTLDKKYLKTTSPPDSK